MTGTALVQQVPKALIKFGQSEHMEALVARGHLYLNTLGYFRGIEGNGARGDPNEGITRMLQASNANIRLGRGNQVVKLDATTGLVGQVKLTVDEELDQNVYCLHAILNVGRLHPERRWFQFGTNSVVIFNVPEFVRRVEHAAHAAGCSGKRGFVRYVAEDRHNGSMGGLFKFDRYAYQMEYRILLAPFGGRPRELFLGSLHDVAKLVPTAELPNLQLVE